MKKGRNEIFNITVILAPEAVFSLTLKWEETEINGMKINNLGYFLYPEIIIHKHCVGCFLDGSDRSQITNIYQRVITPGSPSSSDSLSSSPSLSDQLVPVKRSPGRTMSRLK